MKQLRFIFLALFLLMPTVHAADQHDVIRNAFNTLQDKGQFVHDPTNKVIKLGLNLSVVNQYLGTVGEQVIQPSGPRVKTKRFSTYLSGNSLHFKSWVRVIHGVVKTGGWQSTDLVMNVEPGRLVIRPNVLHFDLKGVPGWIDKAVRKAINKDISPIYIPMKQLKLPSGEALSFLGLEQNGQTALLKFSYGGVNQWQSHIMSGKPTKITLNKYPSNIGTLARENLYTLVHSGGRFYAYGYNTRGKMTKATYTNADLSKSQISIWGAVFTFDANGNVFYKGKLAGALSK